MFNWFNILEISDKLLIISILITSFVSIISIFIALKSLQLTKKSIFDSNRPYVVIYIDDIQVLRDLNEYIIIKNFGKTGATIDSVTIDPPYNENPTENPFAFMSNTFIAPKQSFTTNIPTRRTGKMIRTFSIDYHDNYKKYNETYTINEKCETNSVYYKVIPNSSTTVQEVITKATEEILRKRF